MNTQEPRHQFENVTEDLQDFTSQQLGLHDLLRTMRARKWLILGAAAIVIAITAIVISQITPRYRAVALVLLDQRPNKVVDVNAIVSGLPTDPTSIENQLEILKSRTLLARVVNKLSLDQDIEFAPSRTHSLPMLRVFSAEIWARLLDALSALNLREAEAPVGSEAPDAGQDAIIDRLQERLTVETQGRSTAIEISFASASASKAALIANALADAYIEDQLSSKFEVTQNTSKWLSERLQQLSAQAQSSQAAAQQYRAQYHLTDTSSGGGTIVQQQLGQINTQLVAAQAELAEQEAKYTRMLDLQKSGRAADVSEVVSSPLISQLRGQEADLLRQIGELSTRYGPFHPKMRDVESQKRNLDTKITEEIQRVVETVSNAVTVARARVKSLQDSLTALTRSLTEENQIRVKLSDLESVAVSNRSLYESVLAKSKEVQGQQEIQAPDARIISRAEVPRSANFPNKFLAFGMAGPGGLLLGFTLAILVERMGVGFRTRLQVERLLGLPVFSTLPEVRRSRKENSVADRVVTRPLCLFSEGIHGMSMGLFLSKCGQNAKVVLVSSAWPDEGKTTVAIALARLAARSGKKVFLVDADLRRPSVARKIGEKTAKSGIVNVLSGKGALAEFCIKDPLSQLLILPSRDTPDSPLDLLGSQAMVQLIQRLKDDFDLVVIDSPPVLSVNDAKVLAKLSGAILFVVQWEKTPSDAVMAAISEFATLDAPVTGVVLTRADIRRHHNYSYGYANSYRQYCSN
jgi:succinoglycan biosynthesis transport protein ExoP